MKVIDEARSVKDDLQESNLHLILKEFKSGFINSEQEVMNFLENLESALRSRLKDAFFEKGDIKREIIGHELKIILQASCYEQIQPKYYIGTSHYCYGS